MEVRRIGRDDWRQLRELRLRALADAPHAFRATLADESAKPDEWWQEWAAEDFDSPGTTLAALDGDRWVGLAGVFLADDPEVAIVVAMWVDPAARRHGVGRLLVDAAEAWGAEAGARRLRLSVTSLNPDAHAFYRRLGFEETGDVQPAPGRPDVLEIELERPIAR